MCYLGNCPDGWLNAGQLGGCYLFNPNGPGLNWQQSVDFCNSIGGYLTDILNQETETFLDNSGFVQRYQSYITLALLFVLKKFISVQDIHTTLTKTEIIYP